MDDTTAKNGSPEEQTGNRTEPATTRRALQPLTALRAEMDRLFDDFLSGFPATPFTGRGFEIDPWRRLRSTFGETMPTVDVTERDREYRIVAELPGMDENDVDVSVADGVLHLKGEKKQESEEKDENHYVSERRFGSFQRSFRLPADVDAEKIEAGFKNGVLTVVLPKSAETAGKRRKINVRGAA